MLSITNYYSAQFCVEIIYGSKDLLKNKLYVMLLILTSQILNMFRFCEIELFKNEA